MGTDNKSELIIEAGERVFPVLGYHKATVEDIIKEAGVARSTFYAYFSNKREIFETVVTHVVDGILEAIESGIDLITTRFGVPEDQRPPDSELAEALVDVMAGVLGFIDENKGITKIFFNDLVGIDDEMTRLFHDFQDRFTGDFERLMKFGVAIGFLRDVNERRAAEFIVGGMIHIARNISSEIVDYNVREISEEIIDIQLNGVRLAPVSVSGRR